MNIQIFLVIIFITCTQTYAQQTGLSDLVSGKVTKKTNVDTSRSTTQAMGNHITPTNELEKEFQNSQESTISQMKKIFESEVLPNAPYFMIGNFNQIVIDPNDPDAIDSHSEIQADIDMFWRYMHFKVTNFTVSQNPGVCIQSRSDTSCVDCEIIKNSLTNIFTEKLNSRGFISRTGPAMSIPLNDQSSSRGDKAFEEYMAKLAAMSLTEDGKVLCESGLYFEVSSNEKHDQIKVSTFFDVKNLTGRLNQLMALSIYKINNQDGTKPSDTKNKYKSAQSIARLIANHQIVQLFSQKFKNNFLTQKKSNSNLVVRETYLELKNVDQYLKYNNFKQIFNEILPEVGIEERVLKQNIVRFALKGVGNDSGMIPLDTIISKIKQSQLFAEAGLRFDVIKNINPDEEVILTLK